MLNNIRKFSKTLFAKILLVIIIIPFVFWGMGGVFSGGNSNNVVKINNKSISTQNLVNYLNSSNIDSNYIKENIENNALEELLGDLISQTMLSLEINDLNLLISDEVLNKIIKENKNFQDESKKFSRIKYEKFLLSSNLSAPGFESKLKENELKKNLLSYISGGIISPSFLTNKTYNEQNKKINIDYINLENIYKKKRDVAENEIIKFIEDNKEKLKEKNVSFNYSKITPKNLIGIDDYNEIFFKKIDEIENEISRGNSYQNLINKYKLKTIYKENLRREEINLENKDNNFYKKIFKESNNKIELLDLNDYYVLYEIKDIKEILPKVENIKFRNKVLDLLLNNSKYEFNTNLIKKISKKKFNQSDFEELSIKNSVKINNIDISSIKDDKKFSIEGVKYLYGLAKNNFSLIADKNNNIYLIKILNIFENKITKDFKDYKNQTNIKLRDQMYSSYDFLLSKKYKVKINQKTLERVKNYFR